MKTFWIMGKLVAWSMPDDGLAPSNFIVLLYYFLSTDAPYDLKL